MNNKTLITNTYKNLKLTFFNIYRKNMFYLLKFYLKDFDSVISKVNNKGNLIHYLSMEYLLRALISKLFFIFKHELLINGLIIIELRNSL